MYIDMLACMCIRVYLCMRARTLVYMYTHVTCLYACVNVSCRYICIHICICVYTNASIDGYTHRYVRAYVRVRTDGRTDGPTFILTYIHAYKHTYAHAYALTHIDLGKGLPVLPVFITQHVTFRELEP